MDTHPSSGPYVLDAVMFRKEILCSVAVIIRALLSGAGICYPRGATGVARCREMALRRVWVIDMSYVCVCVFFAFALGVRRVGN